MESERNCFTLCRKRGQCYFSRYRRKAGAKTVTKMKEQGKEALFVQTDVRLETDIIRLMEVANQTYGQIDILINNAGKELFKSPYDISLEEWDDVISTNLRSVFLGSREATKYMRHNKEGGSIVNIASTRAIMSEPNSESYLPQRWDRCYYTCARASFSEDRLP